MPGSPGIAVVSAPKTGSTFIYQLLCRILDLDPIAILRNDPAQLRLTEEADLARAPQVRAMSKPGIAHAHLLPNANTLLFLERSSLLPVIIWRSIEDCVVSLREEWERQWLTEYEQVRAGGHSLQFLGIVPWIFVHTFLRRNKVEQHDLVIDLAVSWYCRFISGWRWLQNTRKALIASIDYESLARDELKAIQNLFQQIGMSVPDQMVSEHITVLKANRVLANINVGQIGRGNRLLTGGQKARIREIMVPFGLEENHD
jgi:hypothetical protein